MLRLILGKINDHLHVPKHFIALKKIRNINLAEQK